MRKILLSAALLMSLTGLGARADDTGSPPSPAPAAQAPPDQGAAGQAGAGQKYPGPITGGVFRQPTQSEIDSREHENKATEREGQEQNQEIEQLYKQLIQPNGASK